MSHEPPAADRARAATPLSVAFISPGWPPGAYANGIVPYIADIAVEMRRAGHRVSVVAERVVGAVGEDVRDASPSRRPPSLAARAVDILAYRASSELGERRQTTRALIAECRRLVDERGVQLVEIEESYGRARWLQKALPVPIVVRLHGPWFLNGPLRGAAEDGRFRERVRLEKEAILAADAVTAPSLDVLERTRVYYGSALERAEVIPNPTLMVPAEDRWTPEGAEAETILFVGRFDRHKGGDLVIDAFAEIARRRPSSRLIFAGPDTGYFDDSGRRWPIEGYIAEKLPGAVRDRVEWVRQQPTGKLSALRRKAAVVVVCSRYETFGLTLAESMAAGCPTVASRSGAFPELMRDGVNGLLCRPDDAGDLAEKIGLLLDDEGLASRLGSRAALDAAGQFDPARIAERTVEFYRRLIEGRDQEGRRRVSG